MGNELYGDDGVGILAVRQLKEEMRTSTGQQSRYGHVDFEECSLSGLSLLEVMVGYDKLVIIDTIKKENPVPGRIHLLEQDDLRHIPGPSPHYVSVPQTLAVGKKLGLKVPEKIKIIAVEAKNMYNLGEGLTQDMAASLPSIIKKARKELEAP
ncbi:MAG: hydrogenase maturation protease [Candidatus Aminicenantes bacterium]